MFEFLAGLALGAVVVGFVANRKPEWFASLVRLANLVDTKVNAVVKPVVVPAPAPTPAAKRRRSF